MNERVYFGSSVPGFFCRECTKCRLLILTLAIQNLG